MLKLKELGKSIMLKTEKQGLALKIQLSKFFSDKRRKRLSQRASDETSIYNLRKRGFGSSTQDFEVKGDRTDSF